MELEQIAKKYVHGLHDALTDKQEIKDMMNDIKTYAHEYHQAKLKLLGIGGVVGQSEQYHCELFDFGRCKKPCDKQCDSCYWMESKKQ